MKNYVISRNIITKQMINDHQNYFLTGWRRSIISGCSLIGFILAVLSFMIKDYIQAGLMLAVSIFGIAEIFFIQNSRRKELIKSFGEHEEVVYSLSFVHDGFSVVNVTNKLSTKIPYSEIAKIEEIKEGYVIVTKGNGFFIINKEALKNGIGELNDFLKSQGVQLYRWPK